MSWSRQQTDSGGVSKAKIEEIAQSAVSTAVTEIIEGDIDLTGYVKEDATQTLTNKTLTEPIIATIKNQSYTLTVPSKSGTLATTSDIPGDPDLSNYATLDDISNMVSTTDSQTLTNKTLSEPILNAPSIRDSTSHIYTLPVISGNTTIATTTSSQTLTNKTLTSPVIQDGSNQTYALPSITEADTLVTRNATQTLSNKTLIGPGFKLNSAQGYILSVPFLSSADSTVATTDTEQTLSNKDLAPSNSISQSSLLSQAGGTINFPNPSSGTSVTLATTSGLVTTTGTQTLTNKTLTSPKISTIQNSSFTINVPTKDGTIALTSDIPTVPEPFYTETTTFQYFTGWMSRTGFLISGIGYLYVVNMSIVPAATFQPKTNVGVGTLPVPIHYPLRVTGTCKGVPSSTSVTLNPVQFTLNNAGTLSVLTPLSITIDETYMIDCSFSYISTRTS